MHIEEPQFHQLVSSAKSRIHLWECVLRVINVKTMLEVGVWKGEYAQQILAQCDFIQRYYMIIPGRIFQTGINRSMSRRKSSKKSTRRR